MVKEEICSAGLPMLRKNQQTTARVWKEVSGGLQRVLRNYVKDFQIPLPPLSVQEELATEIEGYQKIIEQKKLEIFEEKNPANHRPRLGGIVDAASCRVRLEKEF